MSSIKTDRIYKIICSQSDICYVGSTFNTLRDRFRVHKYTYNNWLKGRHHEIAIYPYFKEHGIDSFRMILIKEYEVVDRAHLQAYEQLWMDKFRKTAVNKANTFKIEKLYQKAYRSANKDKISECKKRHYEANREQISEYQKQYNAKNKDKINERKKQYNAKNREQISEYKKQYYEANRSHILERQKQQASQKIQCDCGSTVRRGDKPRHERTAKHQAWLQSSS